MFFDSDAYIRLEDIVKEKAMSEDEDAIEDLSYLKVALMSCFTYVYRVAEQETEARFAAGILKGEELRQRSTHFDETRRAAHEKAIVNTRVLNRISQQYGVSPVFLGDPSRRFEIGSFCGEVSNWIFTNRGN